MRLSLVLSAALASFIPFVSDAFAQSAPQPIGVTGNRVEMLLGAFCSSSFCRAYSGQNTTGKVILVTKVTCSAYTAGAGLDLAELGPMATATGNTFIKRAYFDNLQVIQRVGLIFTNGGQAYSNYLSASPDLLFGPGRYLSVHVTGIQVNNISLNCLASGVFAQ